MRKTLTARRCETLSCPSPRRRIDYRDTVVPGLCLRVTATEQATVIDFIGPVTGAVDEIRVFGVAPSGLNNGNVLLA